MSVSHPEEGVIRVCGEEEINYLSATGFRLREIIYTDELKTLSETIPRQDPSNFYNNRSDTGSKQALARVPRFVMVQSGDLAIAEKQGVIDALSAQLREAKENTKKAVNEASGQKARADRFERELETAVAKAEHAVTRQLDLNARNIKLEGDIGKIRAAIGEIRMKEIIG